MKTCLIAINAKYIHTSLAPWYLASEYDGDLSIFEWNINLPLEGLIEEIKAAQPDMIGISCYIWNISYVRRLLPLLPAAKIILGGPEVSYHQECVFEEFPQVDFLVSGEGEKPFRQLLFALENEGDLAISGVSRRGHISAPYVGSGTPKNPYSEEYLKRVDGKLTYLEASRGCPFSCSFCLSGRCGPVRYFDLDVVKERIVILANLGTRTVKFVDRTFNANKERAAEILTFILQNYGTKIPEGVCFHFEIAGDILDERLFSIIESAPRGAFQFEIGIQSFDERVLEAICRKTDSAKLISNIKRLVSLRNAHIHIDLIAGLPFGDFASVENDFNIAFALKADMLQFGFLKILHGAPIQDELEKFGICYSEKPPYEVSSTKWLSKEELLELHKFEETLKRVYNRGAFKDELENWMKKSGKTPFRFFYDFRNQVQKGMQLDVLRKKLLQYCGEDCKM